MPIQPRVTQGQLDAFRIYARNDTPTVTLSREQFDALYQDELQLQLLHIHESEQAQPAEVQTGYLKLDDQLAER